MYTLDNTAGYTQDQLDKLNEEFAQIVKTERIDIDSDDYAQRLKQFQNDVAKR